MFRYSSRFGFVTRAAFALCLFLLAHASQAYQRVVVEPKFVFRNGFWNPVLPFRDTAEQAFADLQAAVGCNSTACITLSNLRPEVAGRPFDFNFNGVPYWYIWDRTECSGGYCNTTEGGGITADARCPIGFGAETSGGYSIDRKISCVKYFPDATPPPCTKSCIGNPILAATGEKLQVESDYVSPTGLTFVRTYRSGSGMFSSSITSAFMDYSAPTPQFSAACLPASYVEGTSTKQYCFRYMSTGDPAFDLFNADGRRVRFSGSSSAVTSNADIIDRVQLVMAGAGTEWKVTRPDDAVEFYSSTGLLLRKVLQNGQTFTNAYSDASTPASIAPKPGLLISQTGPFGHVLHWTYTASGFLSQMIDPAGSTYSYSYDAAGNLSAVTFPGGTTRSYIYNESANTSGTDLPTALTGITDEQAARFATYKYNSSGQAISTEHAGGVEKFEIPVLSPGSYAAVTDPLGTQKNYSFQTILSYVRDKTLTQPSVSGDGTVFENSDYDANGNLSSFTDFNGNVITRVFDLARNLETSRTEAVGTSRERTITTQWHGTYRLPRQIDEPGRRTTYTYDSSGNALTKTVLDTATSVSRVWTYTYNTFGQVLTTNGPRTDVSDVTTYTYYNCTSGYQCGQVNTITNALGDITTYNTYNAHGQPLTITDPNGSITTLTYDLRQRLTSRTVGGEQTTFAYWPTGLLKKATLPDGSYLEYTYDAAHRLTAINDAQGNSIVYTLDLVGNRTKEESFDSSLSLARTRSQVFDALNHLSQQLGAAATPAVTTTYGYDNNGNQTSIDAPLGRSTTQTYDELNRLSSVVVPDSGLTQYGYNALDQLISVTDPRGLATTYTYNGLGDLKQQVSPDTGTTNNTYDSGGNLKTSTDARNAITTYTYDALNRVKTAAFKVGSTTDQTITYNYDAGTHGKGQLTSASDSAHSMSWVYDPQGRVTNKTQVLGSVSKSAAYGYTNGQLTSLTTPSGQLIGYSYSNGQVSGITVNGTQLLNTILYDPFGPARQWSWGNGTLSVRTFDDDGKITQVDSAGLNTYAYDDAFRITGITDTSNSTLSWTYGYDDLDRLTSASTPTQILGWGYDPVGNRLSQTGSGASTFNISATSNRLSSVTGTLARTYTYDAAGNITNNGSRTFAYNNRGRMKSTTSGSTVSYTYNALGQRIKKSGTVRLFIYDEAGHLLGEYSSTGALVQETIWLGDTPVATIRPKTGGVDIFYVHADHLNTPRKVTRPSDNKLRWRWDSTPFGTGTPNENPQSLGAFSYNLRFPGQYYDAESGLSYNSFRDFDPATGRYVQSDPIGLVAGLNTYAYVSGNPIKYVDPSGLDIFCEACHAPGSPSIPQLPNRPAFPPAANTPADEPGATDFTGLKDQPAANEDKFRQQCPDDECQKLLADLRAKAAAIRTQRDLLGSSASFALLKAQFRAEIMAFNTICPQFRVEASLLLSQAFLDGP